MLVPDDKAQAFRKEPVKADTLEGAERLDRVKSAKALYAAIHNRVEIDSVWGEHLELEEQAHNLDLLDHHRPKHWESLAAYLKRFEVSSVAAEPETEPEHSTEAEEVLCSGSTGASRLTSTAISERNSKPSITILMDVTGHCCPKAQNSGFVH